MFRRTESGCVDIQEIFGSQFELPDLGALGSHGLANPRDFESPVASFDIDQSPWKGTCWFPTKRYAFFDVAFLICSYLQVRYDRRMHQRRRLIF
jgi:homogentisate 1,2-dioxygenase